MGRCARCGQALTAEFRFCPACGAPASDQATGPGESRKVVTALFCDIVGSTSLGERTDAETVRRVMMRYFEAMRSVVERHGGTVDKFIGDAVMAVFGIPVAHEDDALRAVRAAADMRRELADLNEALEADWSVRLDIRIGINTGEALAGGMAHGQTLVLSDAVNVAARLQNAASVGGIVLGEETVRLAGSALQVVALPPMQVKGRAAPLRVYELMDVADEPAARAHASGPLVARDDEIARLVAALESTATSRRCRLMAVTGPPGIGKSRLAEELSVRLAGRAAVHAGRCPSYGEDITLRPLATILHDLVGPDLHTGLLRLLRDLPQADAIATLVSSALGEEASAAGAAEESFWAFRRVLEAAAAERPLVLVLDDLHWAQPMLLDLLEHLVDQVRDAPLLVIALARQDLFDLRPEWLDGPRPVEVMRLAPLSLGDSEALVDRLVPPSRLEPTLRAHVIEQAEGNPLFLEQLLAYIEQTEDPDLRMPPTIQALLAARLDRLSPEERQVCERAAVIGRTFNERVLNRVGAAQTPDHRVLEALARQDLMRRDASDGGSWSFAHALIRDAAYEATPKERRASLHEQVAAQLEASAVAGAEHHQLIGHHLEQAYRLSRDLGRPEERLALLRESAAEQLGMAGRQALDRADAAAATQLLRRAVGLHDPRKPARIPLALDLIHALWMADLPQDAAAVIERLERTAADEHERALACTARAMFVNRYGREESGDPEALSESIRTLEALGDDRGLARARWAAAMALALGGRLADAERECEAALAHARAASDDRMVTVLLSWLADYAPLGPLPVKTGLDRCRRLHEELRGRPFGELSCCWGMALLHAMAGDGAAALERLGAGRAILEEVAMGPAMAAWADFNAGAVALLAGDVGDAEAALSNAHEAFEHLGQHPSAQQAAALLARALCRAGRYDEAMGWAAIGERIATLDPAIGAVARGARARALANLGQVAEAEPLARDAVASAAGTDEISERADTLTDLAEVQRIAGHTAGAAEALREAIDLYDAKGNVASARGARAALDELARAATRS